MNSDTNQLRNMHKVLKKKPILPEDPIPWPQKGMDYLKQGIQFRSCLFHKKINYENKQRIIKKQDSNNIIINLQKQWTDLEINENEFRDLFINTNIFLRSNIRKRENAIENILKHQEYFKKINKDVRKISKYCQYYRKNLLVMQEQLNKNTIYEDFLQKVVNETGMYKHINDILFRHGNLIEVSKVTQQSYKILTNHSVTCRTDLNLFIKKKIMHIQELKLKYVKFHKRYNDAQQTAMFWETQMQRIDRKATDIKSQLPTVQNCIANLSDLIYQRYGGSHKKEPLKKLGQSQLKLICDYLKVFSDMVDIMGGGRKRTNLY